MRWYGTHSSRNEREGVITNKVEIYSHENNYMM